MSSGGVQTARGALTAGQRARSSQYSVSFRFGANACAPATYPNSSSPELKPHWQLPTAIQIPELKLHWLAFASHLRLRPLCDTDRELGSAAGTPHRRRPSADHRRPAGQNAPLTETRHRQNHGAAYSSMVSEELEMGGGNLEQRKQVSSKWAGHFVQQSAPCKQSKRSAVTTT
jgi:hypothetical protein